MSTLNQTDPAYITAMTYFMSGEWKEAEQAFKELAKVYPDSEIIPLQIGNINYSIGHLDDAVQAYLDSIEIKKDYGIAYYKLGVCYFRMGKLREALEAFDHVLHLRNQSHAMASYFMGLINFLMGRDGEADRNFTLFRGISKESLIANFFLAQLKLKEHRHQEALDLLQELVEQSPEFAEGCYMIGQAYYGLHRNTEAIKWYRKALELSPEDARIRTKLSLLTEMEW